MWFPLWQLREFPLIAGVELQEVALLGHVMCRTRSSVLNCVLFFLLSLAQGMIALRHGATELTHEDYMEGILEVQAKKKANLQYYA